MDRKILIVVENLPVPFDTRVWQEATTLAANGYTVSVICPIGKAMTKNMNFYKEYMFIATNCRKMAMGLWDMHENMGLLCGMNIVWLGSVTKRLGLIAFMAVTRLMIFG